MIHDQLELEIGVSRRNAYDTNRFTASVFRSPVGLGLDNRVIGADGRSSVQFIDFDGDGKLDISGSHFGGKYLAWNDTRLVKVGRKPAPLREMFSLEDSEDAIKYRFHQGKWHWAPRFSLPSDPQLGTDLLMPKPIELQEPTGVPRLPTSNDEITHENIKVPSISFNALPQPSNTNVDLTAWLVDLSAADPSVKSSHWKEPKTRTSFCRVDLSPTWIVICSVNDSGNKMTVSINGQVTLSHQSDAKFGEHLQLRLLERQYEDLDGDGIFDGVHWDDECFLIVEDRLQVVANDCDWTNGLAKAGSVEFQFQSSCWIRLD
ncbi:MAG: hypothetical protein WBD20_01280 [Pirellulaceae bacterium]